MNALNVAMNGSSSNETVSFLIQSRFLLKLNELNYMMHYGKTLKK